MGVFSKTLQKFTFKTFQNHFSFIIFCLVRFRIQIWIVVWTLELKFSKNFYKNMQKEHYLGNGFSSNYSQWTKRPSFDINKKSFNCFLNLKTNFCFFIEVGIDFQTFKNNRLRPFMSTLVVFVLNQVKIGSVVSLGLMYV